MSELKNLQVKFVQLEAKWVEFAFAQGYTLTHGEGRVSAEYVIRKKNGEYKKIHMLNSLHYLGIAADWNLFVNGVYMESNCPEWQILGKFWKSLDPLCRWGGDFAGLVDLNHISLEYEGRK